MSYDALENEPISISEPETRKKSLPDSGTEKDSGNFDLEKIVRAEYRNGMKIEEGEVTDGQHKDHRWLRAEGGPVIEGAELGTMVLGGTSVNVEQLHFHHASIVLEQGESAGKDPKGFNSIKARAIVTVLPEVFHDEEQLRGLNEGEELHDNQGRPVSKVRHTQDGKVIAEQTSYLDDEGVMVTTGLHTAGPEQGKMYETRRAMRPEASLAVPTQTYQTPRGNVENLRLVSMTSDIRPADQVRKTESSLTEQKQQTVWLEFQGDWNGS